MERILPPRPDRADSPVQALIRAHDWAATPLGPASGWPQPLRTLLGVMLGASQPMFVAWGPGRTLLYNDAYAAVLAGKHPAALGRDFLEVWHEIRDDLRPIVERALDGEPVQMDDITLMMERRGYPEETHFAFSYTPVRDESGAVAGFFCACQETTGHVLTERRLRESEARAREEAERVRLALDAGAILGTWNWDLVTGRFTADERFAVAFGLDPEDCRRGLRIDQVVETVHPEDLDRLNATMDEAIARGGAYAHQYRVRRRNGRHYWIEANGRVDLGPDGTPLRFPGVLLDIEARRAAEAERDRATRMLETFAEAVPGVVYAKDREGRMLVANRGTTELIGKPPEQYLGRTDAQFLNDPDQARAVMENDRRIMETGVAEQVEEAVSRPDGTPAVWFSTKAPLRDARGAVVGLIGASIDITARKRTEAALRESEDSLREATRRLDAILNNTREAVFLMDDRYRCVYANAAAERLTGHRFEALRGRPLHDVVHHTHPDGRPYPLADCPIGCASLEGRRVSGEEIFVAPDGSFYPVAYTASPVLDEEGRAVGTVLEARGIAEEKAAEAERQRTAQALAEAMADLEATFDAVPVAVWIARDPEARRIDGNRAARELLRVRDDGANQSKSDPEAAQRLRHFRLLDTEGRELAPEDLPVQRAARGEIVREFEERIAFDDGSEVALVGNAVPLLGADGRTRGAVAAFVDVTGRRKVEAALRESEERFRFALDAAGGIGTWDWDVEGDRIHASELFAEMCGVDPERARSGLPVAEYLAGIHPDDRAEVQRLIGEAVAGGGEYRAEYRILGRDGGVHWVIARGRCLRDAEGRSRRFPGVAFDITERKAAEEELRARTAELESLLVSAPLGIAFFDREHRWLRINEELAAINGFSVEGHIGRRLEDLLPVNAAIVAPVLDQVFATGETLRGIEVSGETAAAPGQIRHWLVSFYPVRDAAGAVASVGVWVVDITARKEAEARAQEESRLLETLNRAGATLAGELDIDRLLQRLTDAAVEIVGARFGAFFQNVRDPDGERFHLYTLSGANPSDFAGLGGVRATGVFAPTFSNEGVVRSDDILRDPRHGQLEPHRGMPPGHLPVRSYMGVPVVSRSGEVLGGLLFGHPDPGRFDEKHERLVVGLAAQAAIAIDNARLFREVQEINDTLERRVADALAERAAMEEQLRQSQKMEAVGQLTGGIAHDFNNMLAAVIGSLDLLRRRLGDADERSRRYLDAAGEGARRAALLTQRLLAFSRQQPLRPEPVDVNRLVLGMSDLVQRSLGAGVQLGTVLAEGLWTASADPNQLENVILNLAVNARDAMPEGGHLTIETANAHLDSRYATEHFGLPAGQYVLIAVTDTGTGMPPEVVAKAFDPFFTTKPVGQGTGLGLSQVYGFVKQSGGHVKIYSEPGQGTTVKVYLPRLLGSAAEAEPAPAAPDLPRGEAREVVLVVEDEPIVRQFTVEALGVLGYGVLEADGAETALRLLDAHPEVGLLFTDIVMPETNGRKLADEVLRRRPGLRVLFTTGYTRDAVVNNGVLDPGVHLLGKPFTVEQLAARLREVLDAPPG
ncbi:PAS domain-containing protein [Rubellimicrobium roseum]|nr:PAS domain-containing protein [Rubellimicrobium roseum]